MPARSLAACWEPAVPRWQHAACPMLASCWPSLPAQAQVCSALARHPARRPLPRPPPQNHFLIATKTISADVYVFDYSKHPSKPAAGAVPPRPPGRRGASHWQPRLGQLCQRGLLLPALLNCPAPAPAQTACASPTCG